MNDRAILNDNNKEFAKKCFKKIVDVGIDFKLSKATKKKIFDNKYKEKIFEMPKENQSIEDIIKEMEESVLPYCTNWSSPNFMGFPDAGNSIAGISRCNLFRFFATKFSKRKYMCTNWNIYGNSCYKMAKRNCWLSK